MCKLKKKLQHNELTIGTWQTINNTSVTEILSQSGFEWITVDIEHSAITINEMQDIIRIIELYNISPLVRVGENNANLIKRAMDAGAFGVIVPMVNTKNDAVKAVESVKYPPVGKRGVGLARAQKYGFGFEEYKEWLKKDSVVIVQIEHIDAINNLEEILSVPGVDGSIIGPYDLSGSLGVPGEFDNPEVKKALNRYEEMSSRLNKPLGVHVVQPIPDEVNKFMQKGYKFIAVGLDTLYLGNKIREVISTIK